MYQPWVERVVRPAVRATWKRRTWLTVRSQLYIYLCIYFHLFIYGLFSLLSLLLFLLAGIKESVCWTPPPEVNPNKTCEYQALCSRFKDLLTLPGEFYSSLSATISLRLKKKIMQQTMISVFSITVRKMVTSTKMQSTTCATVSPATSCGVTRLITREESRLATTPCPLDGAASPSGESH